MSSSEQAQITFGQVGDDSSLESTPASPPDPGSRPVRSMTAPTDPAHTLLSLDQSLPTPPSLPYEVDDLDSDRPPETTSPVAVSPVISQSIETSPTGATGKSTSSTPLRRTVSTLSTGSSSASREKKRLRFTTFTRARPDESDVLYPGQDREGHLEGEDSNVHGRHRVPKDQRTYLTSTPGTPNISET
jgi:hypothetical protein